jgi:hypothetical protein
MKHPPNQESIAPKEDIEMRSITRTVLLTISGTMAVLLIIAAIVKANPNRFFSPPPTIEVEWYGYDRAGMYGANIYNRSASPIVLSAQNFAGVRADGSLAYNWVKWNIPLEQMPTIEQYNRNEWRGITNPPDERYQTVTPDKPTQFMIFTEGSNVKQPNIILQDDKGNIVRFTERFRRFN